jgi:hypothetical protein
MRDRMRLIHDGNIGNRARRAPGDRRSVWVGNELVLIALGWYETGCRR